ncbi:hypothetical protein [Streptomyces sp. NBC_01451]|uniref:hypothetical protein n=1 Tax=Streptomyces sp. NBC_01451 TaxID=2903872 RepID=UPI002E360F80|nr:hypothetical protein [Streptomyces sp. NBC_01451]
MSSIQIVGVHGIRQWDTNALKLGTDWRTALAYGITRYFGAAAHVPGLLTPYYGDVFPKTKRFQLSQPGLDDLTDPNEINFVVETLEEYAPDLDLPEPDGTLGVPPRVRPRITQWLAGLDGKWGRGAGETIVTRIRELYGYLHNPTAAEQARQRIVGSLTDSDVRLVIAHSLGSVIIYDMSQRGEIPAPGANGGGVGTLITCGSPLNWPPVKRHLDVTSEFQLPASITWVNIFDPKDPITAGQGLSGKATGVQDIQVDNGDDPHAARRYLRQEAMARAVRTALA